MTPKRSFLLYLTSAQYRAEYDLAAQRMLQAEVLAAEARADRERVRAEAAESRRRLDHYERIQDQMAAGRAAFWGWKEENER